MSYASFFIGRPKWQSVCKKLLIRVIFIVSVLGATAYLCGVLFGALAGIFVAGSWMLLEAIRRHDAEAVTQAVLIVLLSAIGLASLVTVVRYTSLILPW